MEADKIEQGGFIERVLPALKDKIKRKKSSEIIEDIFFDVMKELVEAHSASFDFIKYLNVFNKIGVGNSGNIQFYAEFINNEKGNIQSDRSKITLNKPNLFDTKTYTIAKLFQDTLKFGESFEYCMNTEAATLKVLNNHYYVHYNEQNDTFCYSEALKGLLEIERTTENFEEWLRILQNCYSKDDKVSHFFLVNGPIYYGADESLGNELSKYVINANIGVSIKDENLKEDVFKFIRQFKKLIEQISFNLTVDIKELQMRKAAVRAAIAQVMARNMSHNFGSHVLSNLTDDNAYDEKLKDETVAKLGNFMSLEQWTRELYNSKKNLQLPYFLRYLKSRMDYLSEVTFGIPSLLTSKMMYSDVMKELDRVRILLNYIAGVSGFKYKFELLFNDNKISYENDIGAAFPSDVLGCHAFYNIIENIIRNTAKHAKKTGITNGEDNYVTFTINFKDLDNCEGIEDANMLYCVEIDNGVKEDRIDELVKIQNKRLNDSVLENNSLRSTSLGLLEMEASAAFLRQIDLPEIESDDYTVDYETQEEQSKYYHERNGKKRLNILKAFNKNGALGYRFFVQKPKEFLFVGSWKMNEVENEGKKKELLNYGIQFLSADEFMRDLDKGIAFAHQFLIYDDSQCKKIRDILCEAYNNKNVNNVKKCLRSYNTLLPLRKLLINSEEKKNISKILKEENIIQTLKMWAWEKYWKKCIGKKVEVWCGVQRDQDGCKIGKNQVVFMNHGTETAFKTHWTGDEEKKIEGAKDCKDYEVWLENLVSKTWGKLPSFNDFCQNVSAEEKVSTYVGKLEDSSEKEQIQREIFEAYHNKVVVLDERVQKFANENLEGGRDGQDMIKSRCLFESTNVHIPFFLLDPNVFDDTCKENVEKYVNEHAKDAFVVIHYGILERMYNGESNTIKDRLEDWSKVSKRLVVTSGRGSHSLDLPDSVCFVNLSSMLYAFRENRNKFIINYLLNQSRRKRNGK